MIRILDSRREEFRLSKAYEQKIDVVNVITAPEIEMLIIHAEGAYDQFKRSGKKPSEFCKTNLRMHDVKSYEIESSSMPRWETNEVFFFAPIRLHRTLKKSKRTVCSPARTTKVRLRGQRETGGFLLNLLCKDESPDVP